MQLTVGLHAYYTKCWMMITTETSAIKSHYINVKCELKLTRGRPFVQLVRLRLVPSSWIMQRDDDGGTGAAHFCELQTLCQTCNPM